MIVERSTPDHQAEPKRPRAGHVRPAAHRLGSIRQRTRGTGIPPRAFTEAVANKALDRQFIYSMAGLGVGLACVLLGLVLLLHGVAGSTGWVVQLLGLKSSLNDAAPGIVLAVAGVVIIWATRYDVKPQK